MFFKSLLQKRSLADVSDLINPADWLIDLFGMGQETHSGERITCENAMLNSNVYTCASILGGDLGKLPIQVFKKRGDGVEKENNHPVSNLLGVRANPFMSAYTFKELMKVHDTVWGNAYANIEWDAAGYPKALWPLDPSKTEPKVDDMGELWYITALPSGEQRKIPYYDVLHFKSISKGGLKGITPISVIREEIGVQQASKKFIGSFYKNGTSTKGVLKTVAPLKEEAKKVVRKEWENLNSGITNAQRIAILDAGFEYQNLGMPLADAQFIETAKFGILEVAKIYKIPPHKLGITDAKYSNMEQQSIEYVKNTLLPVCTNWEQEINYKLFTLNEQKKYYVKFNLTAELRGDAKSRAEYYEIMSRIGAYSINKILELEEMQGIGELGDKHFVSLNYVSLDKMDEYQMAKALKGGAKGGQGEGV